MKKVVYIYGRERDARWKRFQEGAGPDEFMYGYNHFDPAHFSMSFIAKDIAEWSWRRILWEPFERLISWRVKMGFSLPIALENLPQLREADVIVSTVDAVGLPIAALRSWGILRTPMVYFSQGLSDRLEAVRPKWLQQLFQHSYGHYLAACARVLVLGEGAVAGVHAQFLGIQLNVQSVPFGVDSVFWQPGTEEREEYVLSVGSDKGRDYPTLLSALKGYSLTIVTFQSLPRDMRWEALTVGSQYSDLELRSLYQRAACVVIPLKDVTQPSGQSATLQAMACGKAVVLTKTRGLWEPEHMQHLINCYLVPPNNPAAIREGVEYLKKHPDQARAIGERARRTVEERYSSHHFAQAIIQVIESI